MVYVGLGVIGGCYVGVAVGMAVVRRARVMLKVVGVGLLIAERCIRSVLLLMIPMLLASRSLLQLLLSILAVCLGLPLFLIRFYRQQHLIRE